MRTLRSPCARSGWRQYSRPSIQSKGLGTYPNEKWVSFDRCRQSRAIQVSKRRYCGDPTVSRWESSWSYRWIRRSKVDIRFRSTRFLGGSKLSQGKARVCCLPPLNVCSERFRLPSSSWLQVLQLHVHPTSKSPLSAACTRRSHGRYYRTRTISLVSRSRNKKDPSFVDTLTRSWLLYCSKIVNVLMHLEKSATSTSIQYLHHRIRPQSTCRSAPRRTVW